MGNSTKKQIVNEEIIKPKKQLPNTMIEELDDLFNEKHLLSIMTQFCDIKRCYYFNALFHLMIGSVENYKLNYNHFQVDNITDKLVNNELTSMITLNAKMLPISYSLNITNITLKFMYTKSVYDITNNYIYYVNDSEFSHIIVNDKFLIELRTQFIEDIKVCDNLLFIIISDKRRSSLIGYKYKLIIFEINTIIRSCLVTDINREGKIRALSDTIYFDLYDDLKFRRVNALDEPYSSSEIWFKKFGNLRIIE